MGPRTAVAGKLIVFIDIFIHRGTTDHGGRESNILHHHLIPRDRRPQWQANLSYSLIYLSTADRGGRDSNILHHYLILI